MSDAGGGHLRLSQALAAALAKVTDDNAVVRIEDLLALDGGSRAYRIPRLYGPIIRHLPAVYGLAYHATNGKRRAARLVRTFQNSLLPSVQELLHRFQPDVVITTHPLVNGLVLNALEAEGMGLPVLAQITELVSVHATWVDGRITAYSVPTEEARLAALKHGAPADRLRVLGLPIGPAFLDAQRPAAEIRRSLGLDQDRFTILALGGAEGAGGLQMAVEALADSGLDVQMIVVCGRNARLERRARGMSVPFPMRVFGYVHSIPALMAAASVVLTKGGPQSIAEALACGRPVLVTRALPGQEQGNERLVERWGVGFHVSTPARVVAAAARLSLDESACAAMAEAAHRAARPEAGREVAKWALALAVGNRRSALGGPISD